MLRGIVFPTWVARFSTFIYGIIGSSPFGLQGILHQKSGFLICVDPFIETLYSLP